MLQKEINQYFISVDTFTTPEYLFISKRVHKKPYNTKF